MTTVEPSGRTAAPFAAGDRRPAYAGRARGLRRGLGQARRRHRASGGSIPFVTAFAERFPDAEILITGVEDPDTRAHGANESLHLANFERACLAETLLLRNLAAE